MFQREERGLEEGRQSYGKAKFGQQKNSPIWSCGAVAKQSPLHDVLGSLTLEMLKQEISHNLSIQTQGTLEIIEFNFLPPEKLSFSP